MKFLTFLLVALSFSTQAESYIKVPYLGAYDGDTLYSEVDLPGSLANVEIRMYGIDTPEKGFRASCDKERDLAEKAHDYVDNLLKNSKYVYLKDYKWDKYGGRILAKVFYKNNSGSLVNISDKLLDSNLAIEYFGEKKTHNWCE